MTEPTNLTLYRGTTEPWEIAVIEAMDVSKGFEARGQLAEKMATIDPKFHKRVRRRINSSTHCSQLRSGREVILGKQPKPFDQLSLNEIESEIRARVGVETARGTANFYSHFVPCGTNKEISLKFGHGKCYTFKIFGAIFKTVKEYWDQRQNFYGTPLFAGGSNEVLTYTGTVILSVAHLTYNGSSQPQSRIILNSLD